MRTRIQRVQYQMASGMNLTSLPSYLVLASLATAAVLISMVILVLPSFSYLLIFLMSVSLLMPYLAMKVWKSDFLGNISKLSWQTLNSGSGFLGLACSYFFYSTTFCAGLVGSYFLGSGFLTSAGFYLFSSTLGSALTSGLLAQVYEFAAHDGLISFCLRGSMISSSRDSTKQQTCLSNIFQLSIFTKTSAFLASLITKQPSPFRLPSTSSAITFTIPGTTAEQPSKIPLADTLQLICSQQILSILPAGQVDSVYRFLANLSNLFIYQIGMLSRWSSSWWGQSGSNSLQSSQWSPYSTLPSDGVSQASSGWQSG